MHVTFNRIQRYKARVRILFAKIVMLKSIDFVKLSITAVTFRKCYSCEDSGRSVLEVSAGIITNGHSVLCFRKGSSKYDYLSFRYEFPGGKIEHNEDSRQALVRELKEELNLEVSESELNLFTEQIFDYPDFSVHIRYFIVNIISPKYELKEHESVLWSSPSELHKLNWADADRAIISKLEAHLA